MELTTVELQNTIGGQVTASYLNYLIRGASLLLELGRSLGTAIRRINSKKICSL
jgi:hypothetical protein